MTLSRRPPCGGVCVAAFAVEICCIAIRPPQQIYSGASTHPGQSTGHAIPSCPDVCGRLCSRAPAPRRERGRYVQLQATNGGGGGGVLEPYLGSLLTLCDPRRRVWLQKILNVRGLRGPHRAESYSKRNIHKGRRRRAGGGGVRTKRGVVGVSAAVLFSSFCLSPQHLARSLRIRDATPPI